MEILKDFNPTPETKKLLGVQKPPPEWEWTQGEQVPEQIQLMKALLRKQAGEQEQVLHPNLKRVYRQALRLFPDDFIDGFGEEIIFVFRKQWRDAYATNGWRGATWVAILEALGLITSFSAEWATEGRERLGAASDAGFGAAKSFADVVRTADASVVGGGGIVASVVIGGVSIVASVVIGDGGNVNGIVGIVGGVVSIVAAVQGLKTKNRKENN